VREGDGEGAAALAAKAMVDGLATADAAEGLAAFLGKRAPEWPDA